MSARALSNNNTSQFEQMTQVDAEGMLLAQQKGLMVSVTFEEVFNG